MRFYSTFYLTILFKGDLWFGNKTFDISTFWLIPILTSALVYLLKSLELTWLFNGEFIIYSNEYDTENNICQTLEDIDYYSLWDKLFTSTIFDTSNMCSWVTFLRFKFKLKFWDVTLVLCIYQTNWQFELYMYECVRIFLVKPNLFEIIKTFSGVPFQGEFQGEFQGVKDIEKQCNGVSVYSLNVS